MADESTEMAGGSGVCSECGQAEFTWGDLLGAEGHKAVFHPDGPFFTILSTNEEVRVRKCDHCGSLQMFSGG